MVGSRQGGWLFRIGRILIVSFGGHHLPQKASKPGKIHLQIVEVLKRFPEGATGGTIRQELEKEGLRPEDQTHLDRRKRDLKKWFVIKKVRAIQEVDGKKRNVVLYKYIGELARTLDEGQINQRVRAEVIRAAHGRCQMCGKKRSGKLAGYSETGVSGKSLNAFLELSLKLSANSERQVSLQDSAVET